MSGSGNILWVHGWGTSASVWGDPASFLPGWNHHFFTYAGCRTPDDLHPALEAQLSREPGAWTLAGWSLGGMLALDALLGAALAPADAPPRPYRLAAVALIGATLRFASRDRALGWPPRVLERMRAQLAAEPAAVLRSFAAAMLAPGERESAPHAEPALLAAGEAAAGAGGCGPAALDAGLAYLQRADLTARWDAYAALPAEARPARLLWLHGSADAICPPAAMPAAGPGERAVLAGAGHALMLTQRERFQREMTRFVQDGISGTDR